MTSSYFVDLYAADPDPWRFESSEYEAKKYAATLAALSQARYGNALEVGCSVGVFTEKLASRCDRIVAIDPVEKALRKAAERCKNLPVAFERMSVPRAWPVGKFDLIVLSEVVYYLTQDEVVELAQCVRTSLSSEGQVVLVHWTELTDYPLSGDEAAETFIKASGSCLQLEQQLRAQSYRIDVLRRG